jgi:hypothetical protein
LCINLFLLSIMAAGSKVGVHSTTT